MQLLHENQAIFFFNDVNTKTYMIQLLHLQVQDIWLFLAYLEGY